MTLLHIGMFVLSLLWFFVTFASSGLFGRRLQRRMKYTTFDTHMSEVLLRLIDRYKSGELIVQRSQYEHNIIFTKLSEDGTHNELTFYVLSDAEYYDDILGYISESYIIPLLVRDLMPYPINNDAYFALKELVDFIDGNTTEQIQKPKKRFRKYKNEEVHLS